MECVIVLPQTETNVDALYNYVQYTGVFTDHACVCNNERTIYRRIIRNCYKYPLLSEINFSRTTDDILE